MFGSEYEIQARRRTLTVLQDEARRVFDAARDLALCYRALLAQDQVGVQSAIERIRKAEDDVEALRRLLTREVAEMGTMMISREDFLRAAYEIEEIAGYTNGIAFRFSQVKMSVLKDENIENGITELVDMAVESVQRLNEVVRALAINPASAIDLANSVQKVERQVDEKYRIIVASLLNNIHTLSDLLLLKDIVEGLEELADRSLAASDSVTILALGL